MISGIHPDGMPYTFVHEARPLEVAFSDIKWPEGIKHPRLYSKEDSPVLELTEQQSNRAKEQPSNKADKAMEAGCVLVCSVDSFLPTKEHCNNDLQFKLGRAVRGQEVKLGREATEEELRAIFNDWYDKNNYLRPVAEQSKEEYWMEFVEQYDNAKVPLEENPVVYAWKRASEEPYPPEADKFEGERYKRAVSLCYQLQKLAQGNPFYLSCRSLGAVMGKSHEFANRFLKIMAKGPLKVVAKHTADRATRYRYIGNGEGMR